MRLTRGNVHDAEDLIQKAALKAFEKRDRYNDDNFTGLLVTIMRNAFLDEIRKTKGKQFSEYYDFDGARESDDIPKELYEIRKELYEIRKELIVYIVDDYNTNINDVNAALDKMDDNCRALLTLRGEGYKYGEIAEKLSKKIGSVMSGLSRCKNKLRTLLDE